MPLNMIACFTTPILLKITNRRNLVITGLCLQLCAGCLFIVDYQTWENLISGLSSPPAFVISLAWTMSPSAAIGLTPFGKQQEQLVHFLISFKSGASLIIVIGAIEHSSCLYVWRFARDQFRIIIDVF